MDCGDGIVSVATVETSQSAAMGVEMATKVVERAPTTVEVVDRPDLVGGERECEWDESEGGMRRDRFVFGGFPVSAGDVRPREKNPSEAGKKSTWQRKKEPRGSEKGRFTEKIRVARQRKCHSPGQIPECLEVRNTRHTYQPRLQRVISPFARLESWFP